MTAAQRSVSPSGVVPASGLPVCDADIPLSTLRPAYEDDRLSLLRPLDAVVAVRNPLGRRHAAAVDRSRRRGGRARRRRGLFPRPPFRPPARLALSAARG